jgi:hypothetical protein
MADNSAKDNLVLSSTDSPDTLSLQITHHGTVHNLSLTGSATITDLSEEISISLLVPVSNQKLVISKLGLLKPPFKDPSLPLSSLLDKKISLLGSTTTEVSAINRAAAEASRHSFKNVSSRQKVTVYKSHDWAKDQEEAVYTFTTLRTLPYLPNPERSLAFLQRLKDDPGIKATMRKHKWTVPLLTEMNPIEHTQSNHEGTSRTLGLNRNAGEVIELRLRTDAYDGYRDYKTIRKTLCHELAHNVHGPHDRKFWDLCHQIEKEVEGADWRSGGQTVGNQEFYEAGEIDDHGGWQGGEFVLGGDARGQGQGLSRREILAKAAEERIRKLREKSSSQGESSGSGPG